MSDKRDELSVANDTIVQLIDERDRAEARASELDADNERLRKAIAQIAELAALTKDGL